MNFGFFFDCHNTLINSNDAWISAFVDKIGDDNRTYITDGLYGKLKRKNISKKYNLNFEEITAEASKYMMTNELLVDIIKEMKESGIKVFVVSNAPRERVVKDLQTVRIAELFDEVYTGDEGGKQNNKIFDDLLEKYSLKYGFFVGNEEFDDHITHPKIISVVLTSFLRKRFSILKNKYYLNDDGSIKYDGEEKNEG